MSYQGQRRQVHPSYRYSAGGDDQEQDAYQYDIAAHYDQYSQATYTSPLQAHAQAQQRQAYDAAYAGRETGPENWQDNIYGYQGVDQNWDTDATPYSGNAMAGMDSFQNIYQDPSQQVQSEFSRLSFQDHAQGRQYNPGSGLRTGATNIPQVYTTEPMENANWTSTQQEAIAYSQYPQTTQGLHGYQSQTPQLRVHMPQEATARSYARSVSTTGYQADSSYAFAAEGSPMLTASGRTAGEKGDFSSENSPTPDPLPSPSVEAARASDGADPTRKWPCKLAECAGRRPFKRHADLLRHMSTVHHKEDMEKFDCPRRSCPRKGENGFTRKDHLTEHLRNFHVQDIPKTRGWKGKGREK